MPTSRGSLKKNYWIYYSERLFSGKLVICTSKLKPMRAFSICLQWKLAFFFRTGFAFHRTPDPNEQQLANSLVSQFSYRFLLLFLHTFHHFVTHSDREFNPDTPELAQRATASVSKKKTFAIRSAIFGGFGSSSKTIALLSALGWWGLSIFLQSRSDSDISARSIST